jgi:hypothetical protein
VKTDRNFKFTALGSIFLLRHWGPSAKLLVLRFRSSQTFAATTDANFGIIGSTSNLMSSSAVFEFEVPTTRLQQN